MDRKFSSHNKPVAASRWRSAWCAIPGLGPIVVVGAGGVLVELIGDRRVALPPLDDDSARRMIDRLAIRALLDGLRGAAPADIGGIAAAVVSISQLATELGSGIEALDVNPLLCGPDGVVAVDVLVVRSEAGPGS